MSAAVPPATGVPSIEDRVRGIVSAHLGVDLEVVRLEASFFDDLGADSLDRIELLMAVEDEFHIVVPDKAAEGMERVCDVVAFVERTAGR